MRDDCTDINVQRFDYRRTSIKDTICFSPRSELGGGEEKNYKFYTL